MFMRRCSDDEDCVLDNESDAIREGARLASKRTGGCLYYTPLGGEEEGEDFNTWGGNGRLQNHHQQQQQGVSETSCSAVAGEEREVGEKRATSITNNRFYEGSSGEGNGGGQGLVGSSSAASQSFVRTKIKANARPGEEVGGGDGKKTVSGKEGRREEESQKKSRGQAASARLVKEKVEDRMRTDKRRDERRWGEVASGQEDTHGSSDEEERRRKAAALSLAKVEKGEYGMVTDGGESSQDKTVGKDWKRPEITVKSGSKVRIEVKESNKNGEMKKWEKERRQGGGVAGGESVSNATVTGSGATKKKRRKLELSMTDSQVRSMRWVETCFRNVIFIKVSFASLAV